MLRVCLRVGFARAKRVCNECALSWLVCGHVQALWACIHSCVCVHVCGRCIRIFADRSMRMAQGNLDRAGAERLAAMSAHARRLDQLGAVHIVDAGLRKSLAATAKAHKVRRVAAAGSLDAAVAAASVAVVPRRLAVPIFRPPLVPPSPHSICLAWPPSYVPGGTGCRPDIPSTEGRGSTGGSKHSNDATAAGRDDGTAARSGEREGNSSHLLPCQGGQVCTLPALLLSHK